MSLIRKIGADDVSAIGYGAMGLGNMENMYGE
jgi:hypothetical protein